MPWNEKKTTKTRYEHDFDKECSRRSDDYWVWHKWNVILRSESNYRMSKLVFRLLSSWIFHLFCLGFSHYHEGDGYAINKL